jgi:hypothetical protein
MIGEDEESYLRRVLTAEGSGQTIGPLARTLIKHVGHQPLRKRDGCGVASSE